MAMGSTKRRIVALALLASAFTLAAMAQTGAQAGTARRVSGVVVDERSEAVAGATVSVQWAKGSRTAIADGQGGFSMRVPAGEPVILSVTGAYIGSFHQALAADAPSEDLRLQIHYAIPRVQESLVITATAADPAIDRRNDSVYKNTLFLRDDQLFETLDSGINAGQHEGGGKSLEFRRFGFNLDHGGLNGGLKVLVDDIPQNQATQAHGQGYLGWLKALSPELMDGVDIIDGPFSAEYGDFSALGVIHIRLKERFDDEWTLRAQGGSFDGYRTFAAWSPHLKNADSFLSWEHAYTDGPFKSPLDYVRDNITGNYTYKLGSAQSLGFKFNGGRNDFNSSGQIPLDLVYSGALDRFGYMDPSDGGKVRNGTGSVYYKKNLNTNNTMRVDGYVTRSLFDLFSDFTFFLSDPINGDGIQQHDSRLQEGASAQYVHAGKAFGLASLFMAGANLGDNWINVDLFHDKDRQIIAPVLPIPGSPFPGKPWTEANAHITNPAVYAQEGLDFKHLHVDAGLRLDVFRLGNVSTPTLTLYSPKGQNTGVAVVVFPGGGYHILAIDLEGTEVCDWLNSAGITCVLLKYRVPGTGPYPKSAAALQDAQRALGLARAHAAEWHIDPNRIGVLGFSAGAHLAAALSTHFDQRLYAGQDAADKLSCRPDFAVIVYPGYLALEDRNFAPNLDINPTAATPPQFIVQAEDDPVHVENALVYFQQLKNAKVPAELHIYSQGGHGYGLRRTALPVTTWPQAVETWLRTIKMLPAQ